MAAELTMPALSPTMEKGTLARWLVGVGDLVRAGDLVAEVETDKATMEVEAAAEGLVAELLVAEGTDDVPVGTPIARLTLVEEAGVEQASAAPSAPSPVSAGVATPEAPERKLADTVGVPRGESSQLGATKLIERTATLPLALDPSTTASPLAARIAMVKRISLAGIRGSGAGGRITKADLELPSPSAAAAAPSARKGSPVSSARPPSDVSVETVRVPARPKPIGWPVSDSTQDTRNFHLVVRCRLDPLLALRQRLNASLGERGVELSVDDLLMKAMALAMMAVPEVKVQVGDGELHRFDRVDLAMAVAIDGGLATPVLRDVSGLSLSALSVQAQTLAARARDGELTPADYEGCTASIFNVGMFGVDEIVPVVHPPQALTLGLGAGVEQPWKVDGALGWATIITATASFDHRAIDGAGGARFVAAFRSLVESPLRLIC